MTAYDWLTLRWPGCAINLVLEETSDLLCGPSNWSAVATTGSVTNGERVVVLPRSGSARFYRLRLP